MTNAKMEQCEKRIGLSIELQPEKKNRGKPFRQILAAFVANLGVINVGFAFGFSAVAIPQLKAADSSIPIDETQESWIGKYINMPGF